MKVYQVGSGGLWIGILVFGLIILSMFSIGGFLLGTPIGWAILTVLVVRHFYRRYLRRKNFETYTNAYSKGYEETNNSYSSTYGSASDFASAYRQEETDEKFFSSEDKNSAIDVEFKEV